MVFLPAVELSCLCARQDVWSAAIAEGGDALQTICELQINTD